MTTRPIELGLTRNADGQSPTKWQVQVVSTILGGFGAWSADPRLAAAHRLRQPHAA